MLSRFNTSHVTLYPTGRKSQWFCGYKFQYISCYSLSRLWDLLFLRSTCFNTSHVTLYPETPPNCCKLCNVSIHLMLLFITLEEIKQKYTELFQYISCYSLSPGGKNCRILLFVSIHLMLLFISKRKCLTRWWKIVSIHLMLLFISVPDSMPRADSIVSIHLMLLFIRHLINQLF